MKVIEDTLDFFVETVDSLFIMIEDGVNLAGEFMDSLIPEDDEPFEDFTQGLPHYNDYVKDPYDEWREEISDSVFIDEIRLDPPNPNPNFVDLPHRRNFVEIDLGPQEIVFIDGHDVLDIIYGDWEIDPPQIRKPVNPDRLPYDPKEGF